MTSNLGAEHLQAAMRAGALSQDFEDAKQKVLMAIRATLRPELLNRLDDIIVFRPLVGDTLRAVVRLQLADVLKRLEELDIGLELTDSAVDFVLREAHDPELGARPLKRYLERHLVSQLSIMVLKEELAAGCKVIVGCNAADSGRLVFQVELPKSGDD